MFCENCGRPLLDGEVCTCTQQNAAPAPGPAYEPTAPQQPAPAAPVAPEPAPVYAAPQQPAPAQFVPQQPAPQQFAPQQPAPQQFAPQQPAPQQFAPQQPAPQQPAPQQFAPQPVPVYTKPSLDNIKVTSSKYPGYNPNYDADRVGKGAYNRIAVFLSSPLILVYGILISVTILMNLITAFMTPSFTMVLTIISSLVQSLVAIAAIVTFVSAKGYLKTGKPITPVGLTMASGFYIYQGIMLIIVASLCVIAGIIAASAVKDFTPFLVMLVAPIIIIFVGIIPMFSASHAFQGVRYLLTGRGNRYRVSLYPVVMLIISAVFSLIGTLIVISAAGFLTTISRSMRGVPFADQIIGFLFGGSGVIVMIISSIITLTTAILGAVIFLKARKAQSEAYLIND